MFADWLDEHGEPERAEFIRLQCEIARLDDDGSDSHAVYEFLRDRDFVTRPSADWTKIDDGIHRRIALAIRVEDLFKRHGGPWLPKLPKKYKVEWSVVHRDVQSSRFHRGFAHRVALGTAGKLKEVAPRLRAAGPAVTLVAHDFNDRFVEQLADAGLLARIGGLDLGSGSWTGLSAFGRHPEAAAVRTLKVQEYGYGNGTETASALADAPHWTGLRELDLLEISVPGEAAEILFRAKHLRTLKRLHIQGTGYWTADTVRVFASAGFTELTSLRFRGCGLNDEAAEALANCPHLTRLRTLDFPHNSITGRGVTALLTSPHLANVAFLGLEGNPCSALDGARLAAAAPGALRMVHCHGSRLVTADVRALARCPRLRTLWYLDLDDNGFGTPAVRELIKGFGKRCPPIMWLTHNRIDDRGAALIAKWKAASALRVLHLRFNDGMTDAGIRALLDSPHLANLDGLGVDAETDDLDAVLRRRFRHHDIDYD
jgi:hypothetical protein